MITINYDGLYNDDRTITSTKRRQLDELFLIPIPYTPAMPYDTVVV